MRMVLGLRCSNTDYHYALLSGTKKVPLVEDQGSVSYPGGLKKPAALKWMVDEIQDRLRKSDIDSVVIKGPEPAATRTSSLVERVEYETAAMIACAEVGLKAVFKKVKSTLAKDLGLKGKGKYLQTLDTSAIPGFSTLSEKAKEAALAAWTELS
uniref:Holliday junction resolvase RuvC n=1 Tax=Solibacter usitatus (strain Ellin6076) TaxID=234267 RepID=Q01T22_SOLUE